MSARNSSRRSFMKFVAAAPLLSQIAVAESLRSGGDRDRQGSPSECIRTVGCENGNQLSRNMDLPEWFSRIPGSSASPGGSGAIFRQYAGATAWRGASPCGVDRR